MTHVRISHVKIPIVAMRTARMLVLRTYVTQMPLKLMNVKTEITEQKFE